MGRFLQRLADTSSTSSILGDLPPEETDLPPSGRRKEKKGQPGGQGSSADVERWAKETVRVASSTAKMRVRAAGDGERDDGSEGVKREGNIGVASGERNGGGAGDAGEQHSRAVEAPVAEPPGAEETAETDAGDALLHVVPPSQPPPHLVLFARAKGRPFVYCGEVDCVAQEYVWSAGSTRLGAVRLTLALRRWREAAAAATADSTRGGGGGYGGGNGSGERGEVGVEVVDMYRKSNEFSPRGGLQFEEGSDVFADVVLEGLRPPWL